MTFRNLEFASCFVLHPIALSCTCAHCKLTEHSLCSKTGKTARNPWVEHLLFCCPNNNNFWCAIHICKALVAYMNSTGNITKVDRDHSGRIVNHNIHNGNTIPFTKGRLTTTTASAKHAHTHKRKHVCMWVHARVHTHTQSVKCML